MCLYSASTLRRLLVKQSSLVDKIIELYVKWRVPAGIYPDATLLCTVYFMGLVGDKEQALTRTGPDNRVKS